MNNELRQRHSDSDAASDDDRAELERLREAIDRADREILARLNERARRVQRVGELKQRLDVGVYSAGRERDLVEALIAANPGPFPDAGVAPVFREIVSATRSLEATLSVAFLGPEATNCHRAARDAFGEQATYVAVPTIPEVFAAVERGLAQHGVVPVENTSEGVVTAALDTLATSRLPICGERLLRISHQLLSRSGRREDVRRVASHPQALAQCRGWLDRCLPGVERVETASTVAAARLAAQDAQVAAIAGRLAAEQEGLAIVAPDIEDRRDNTTRFLVLGGDEPEASGRDVTCVVFTVRKSESGALHRLLAPFSDQGVNLASIQSRPQKDTPWEYLFFFDLEGHASDAPVRRALEAAAEHASSCRVLGSFPRARSGGGD